MSPGKLSLGGARRPNSLTGLPAPGTHRSSHMSAVRGKRVAWRRRRAQQWTMIDVSNTIVILRPRAEVASYAADPANAPRWYVNIRSVKWRTPPPLRVGSRIDFVAQFLGRRLAYTYEVTDNVPGARLVMSTVDGPFPMETTYEWEDAPSECTSMTLRNRGGPRGVGRLLTPIAAIAVRSANRSDLRRLKAILEAKATDSCP